MIEEDLKAIAELLPKARAKTKGSVDPLFDVIADGEALLAGRPTWGNTDAAQVRKWLEESVAKR